MSKVIRINDKNLQYIEEIRELFAKVKFYENIYWDDNRILTLALGNLKWDINEGKISKHND